MVLNEIIEQAAGRKSSERGKCIDNIPPSYCIRMAFLLEKLLQSSIQWHTLTFYLFSDVDYSQIPSSSMSATDFSQISFVFLLFPVSVYYFQDNNEGYGEDKVTVRDRIMAGCLKCVDVLCVWDCCWCWVRIQEIFALIVFDPFMELFITLCIVVNTLFMAMDHHDMDADFEKVLKAGNYVSVFLM